MTPLTMALRFDTDQANQVSRIRVAGRITDESLAELYETSRRYSTATRARVGIVDLTSVSKTVVSSEFIHRLAHRKPDAENARRDYFIVAPAPHVFGLCRMFQILGEDARPFLRIVHSMDEAIAAIGVLVAPLNLQM